MTRNDVDVHPDEHTQVRLAQVEQRLHDASDRLGRRHPHIAGTVRSAVESLQAGLTRAHSRCHDADDQAWARYSADLDRGLDELDAEVSRAVEQPDGGLVLDDVMYARTTALELESWILHLDTVGDDAGSQRRALVSAAARALADYRAASAAGPAASRSALGGAMDALRGAAG